MSSATSVWRKPKMNKICLCCGKPLVNDNQEQWHQSCINDFFGSNAIPNFHLEEIEIEKQINKNLDLGISISGVQPKLSLSIVSSKGKKRTTLINESNYIIKFGTYKGKSLPIYENVTMLLAKTVGIDVVPNALLFNNNQYFYITKRIDRDHEIKFPMEDFCQLCEKLTIDKYNSSYEYSYRKALKYSDQTEIDAIKFFNLILFSYIVGNTDMHLKNFSLINYGNGYRFSPAYDLLPTEIIANQTEMALSLNGKRKNLTRNDFLVFAESMNIKRNVADRLIDKMVGKKEQMIGNILTSVLDSDEKDEFINFITLRLSKFAAK